MSFLVTPQHFLLLEIFNPNNHRERRVLKASCGCKFYTELPQDVLEELGMKTNLKILYLELVNPDSDKSLHLPLWQVGIKVNDHECVTLAVPSKEAAIGYLTLAELGLKLKSDYTISQIVAYSDPLIYDFIFYSVPEVYESIFAVKPTRELYSELTILYNEWINILKKDILQEWETSSFVVAILSVVQYNLNSMIASLYTGILYSIALGIRVTLEALIAGYFGDLNVEFRAKYSDPLIRLEKALKRIRKKSFRKFCSEYLHNKYIDNVDEILSLWNDLSFNFIHSVGLVRTILRSSELPSMVMGMPFSAYHEGDIYLLMQLKKYIRSFRRVFSMLCEEWNKRRQQT